MHTVAYADVFDYALAPNEVHRYLIQAVAPYEHVESQLTHLSNGAKRLEKHGEWYTLPGRAKAYTARMSHGVESAVLMPQAVVWGKRIYTLPFVRMVALTGALAMQNAPTHDDIDLLIVTAPKRVWFTRAMTIGLVRFARVKGVKLCPNYVLSESAMAQSQRNLFIAHEIAQMMPIAGLRAYDAFLRCNTWIFDYLPNWTPADGTTIQKENECTRIKLLGERLLGGTLGEWLERHEQHYKHRKLLQNQTNKNVSSAAQLDSDQIKGHFNDHGKRILQAYSERTATLKYES
jgi:hypothetical protein